MSDVIYFISETPGAHGVFDKPTEVKRKVFCEVKSVSRNEFYRAMENGISPTYVFQLADYAEYKGEKIAEYNGQRYRVVRTYCDRQRIEITVEEATVDA